ncbi:MAG: acyloxyacyl hydrolase, partial [Planctomycetota bacterium]|nr:acyloxyacyl hydrolase [Planctomycetota bacterium]
VSSHESENYTFLTGVGFEHFIADDLSLVTQFNAAYVDQVGDNAWGANVVFLFRWHFYTQETWSAYVEAGAGLALFTEDVPTTGSDFNFTPQAAMGMTFDIGNDNRAFLAAGWHHISNAQTFDDNPGRDSFILHFGISMPF